VAPRLTSCMEEVISRLESSGIRVETVDTYLLDSSEHTVRVPCALDGFPVQIGFSASLPAWSERVRAHLQVCFAGGRRWSLYEPPAGFQVSRIVARIGKELESRREEHTKTFEETRKKRLAEERLTALSTVLGVVEQAPLTLQQDNLEIVGLADSPSEVRLTLHTSHANAMRIAREFRKVGWQRRKA
jgi:hypothetical protein